MRGNFSFSLFFCLFVFAFFPNNLFAFESPYYNTLSQILGNAKNNTPFVQEKVRITNIIKQTCTLDCKDSTTPVVKNNFQNEYTRTLADILQTTKDSTPTSSKPNNTIFGGGQSPNQTTSGQPSTGSGGGGAKKSGGGGGGFLSQFLKTILGGMGSLSKDIMGKSGLGKDSDSGGGGGGDAGGGNGEGARDTGGGGNRSRDPGTTGDRGNPADSAAQTPATQSTVSDTELVDKFKRDFAEYTDIAKKVQVEGRGPTAEEARKIREFIQTHGKPENSNWEPKAVTEAKARIAQQQTQNPEGQTENNATSGGRSVQDIEDAIKKREAEIAEMNRRTGTVTESDLKLEELKEELAKAKQNAMNGSSVSSQTQSPSPGNYSPEELKQLEKILGESGVKQEEPIRHGGFVDVEKPEFVCEDSDPNGCSKNDKYAILKITRGNKSEEVICDIEKLEACMDFEKSKAAGKIEALVAGKDSYKPLDKEITLTNSVTAGKGKNIPSSGPSSKTKTFKKGSPEYIGDPQ